MSGFISLDRRPALDLRFTHFEHVHSGILVIGTWLMDGDGKSGPCMVLLDAMRRVERKRTIPCVIPLTHMYLWTREEGDPEHVATTIMEWMISGALPGQPHNQADVRRIFDAVQSRLRDLWSMPPMPVGAAVKHGAVPIGTMELVERESGKTVNEIEVVSSHVRH